MADIRIKDLTTEVSSTATGDFFVIDGTTGTRKTPAFSPTFGGNATVTGTLNVNGTDRSQMVGNANTRLEVGNSIEDQRAHIGLVNRLNLGNPIFSKNLAGKSASDAYTTIATTPASGYSGIECGYGGVIRLLNGTGATTAGAEVTPIAVLDTNTTRVAIPLTTASTTTSTGALVVGNGTSGGLGVGGSICLGANIVSAASDGKFQITGTGNTTGTKEITFQRADGGDSTAFGLTGSAYAGVLTGLGNNEAYLYTSNAFAFRIFIGTAATNRFDFTSSQFKINPTTISNSTSSGALVVAGGVGVGGNVTVGGQLDLNSGTASAPSLKLNGTNNGLFYNGSNIVRIAANGTLAASIGVAGSEFSGVLTAGSGTHTFGTSANSASVLVQRITTNPSAVSLNALASFANIDFTSEGGGYTFGAIKSNGSEILRIFNGNLAAITPVAGGGLAVGGGLNVSATTASTSTSSGALVVGNGTSGGLGVGGAVNVGGNLTVNGTITLYPDQDGFFSGSWPRMNFATNGSSVWLSGATTGAATVQHDFRNRSGTSLLTLGGTGNAIFAGNLKTAAPAGGTAAEWKLGTVATVSPTSPNRTIEVDIGGTIYYIHAKTTNN